MEWQTSNHSNFNLYLVIYFCFFFFILCIFIFWFFCIRKGWWDRRRKIFESQFVFLFLKIRKPNNSNQLYLIITKRNTVKSYTVYFFWNFDQIELSKFWTNLQNEKHVSQASSGGDCTLTNIYLTVPLIFFRIFFSKSLGFFFFFFSILVFSRGIKWEHWLEMSSEG